MDFIKKATQSMNDGNEGDLMKQAQSFLSEQQGSEKKTSEAPVPAPAGGAETDPIPASEASGTAAPAAAKEGYGEVYSSAQTLYQGLQDKLSGKTDVDNQKLAGAADDVLKAAKSSGLMGKDNQYSDYLNKAEAYVAGYAAKGTSSTKDIPTEGTNAPKETEETTAPKS